VPVPCRENSQNVRRPSTKKGLGQRRYLNAAGPPIASDSATTLLGSANLSYHFLPSTTDRKLEPFLTAGYSLFFRAGISHGYNVGGGLNVWLDKTVGTRFEIRDQESWYRETLSFRIGVTFR